jgi:hypothetical protein
MKKVKVQLSYKKKAINKGGEEPQYTTTAIKSILRLRLSCKLKSLKASQEFRK